MFNEAFGWLWITLGFASGALLGLFFHRSDWLGGYDAYRRRLIRLGHISFFGLGILNVLFAISISRAAASAGEKGAASWAMIVGGVAMPLCCGLTAWRPMWKFLFVVPVVGLLIGGWTLAVGLLRAALGATGAGE